MKIVRFNGKGNCQFVYFNWKRFRFETSCWAEDLGRLFGGAEGPRRFIGIFSNKKQ